MFRPEGMPLHCLAGCIAFGLLVLLPGLGLAQDAGSDQVQEVALGGDDIINQSARALTILLVLATLIESGLAVIFRWDVYEAYFSRRGLKPVIAVAVSFLLVRAFQIDVFASLLQSYSPGSDVRSIWVTELLTALILAGGSSAVNAILKSLGLRTEESREPVPAPAPDRAWIAVRVVRGKGITGPVRIEVTADESADAGQVPAIAGVAYGSPPSLRSLLLRNEDRFPSNGGYEVSSNTVYRLTATGQSKTGAEVTAPIVKGPVKLAPGAIVDFEVTLKEVPAATRPPAA